MTKMQTHNNIDKSTDKDITLLSLEHYTHVSVSVRSSARAHCTVVDPHKNFRHICRPTSPRRIVIDFLLQLNYTLYFYQIKYRFRTQSKNRFPIFLIAGVHFFRRNSAPSRENHEENRTLNAQEKNNEQK